MDYSILYWLANEKIKNEKGEEIELRRHLYLADIYAEDSQYLAVMKAAQVGMSTLEVLKNLYDARKQKMDIIYTLPTFEDVNVFVGGKVNRIIANNPVLQQYVKDKDSIEQKAVGESMIYFRGTFTGKSAIMVTADRLVHDEIDSSKQSVIADYQSRLQHSKYQQVHSFSHPSFSGAGIDIPWQESDQKHWFVKCEKCGGEQYLNWPDSFDFENKRYVCKRCHWELSDEARRRGRWVAKRENKKYSGYWIPLFICPWVSAEYIIQKYADSSPEFFHSKILGLPYLGKNDKLLWNQFAKNITGFSSVPDDSEAIVMGIDTGAGIDYVLGGEEGLFFHGSSRDYDELNKVMDRWKRAIAVIDAGGDLIGSRKFFEKWKGRVFLCYTGQDRKTIDLVKWGEDHEFGKVNADRNRIIQLVVDEFGDGRIPVHGSEDDWYDYWMDWNNLTRTKLIDKLTGEFRGHKWVRNARDHQALATVYWRVGMTRFGGKVKIFGGSFPLRTKLGFDATEDKRLLTADGRDIVEATMMNLTHPDLNDWRQV